jgi:pimeloyl-ACP methyl ester carboxylesterase
MDKTPQPTAQTKQPLVIFGGFMSFTMLYWDMRDALQRITGQSVFVVDVLGHDWLPTITSLGWPHLLRKLEQTVKTAAERSDTGKVTLIGHSAGGVFARLFLSPHPFMGHAYRGLDVVSDLITLGSPHYNRGGRTRGGHTSRWIENRYPGAYFTPQVNYVAVAGRAQQGSKNGSLRERWTYKTYKEIAGEGNIWGDGLVPTQSALLNGAYQIILDGVNHFSGFGGPWYGHQDVIPGWWEAWREQRQQPVTMKQKE